MQPLISNSEAVIDVPDTSFPFQNVTIGSNTNMANGNFQENHSDGIGEQAYPNEFAFPELKLVDLANRLSSFHERYHRFFATNTRNGIEGSRNYLFGLIQSEKKNMERMAEVVPNTNDQSLQHFISNSTWNHVSLLEQIAKDADAILGGTENSYLIIDESGFVKKGGKSVGVSRQWIGRLGKIDNCQVGVYASLGCGDEVALIALPGAWCDDLERCRKANVPEAEMCFRTKAQLALEMVRHARIQGIRYAWIGVDGGYGKEPWFLRELDKDGEKWVADVHKDQMVYLEDPMPFVPERKSPIGRAPSRLVSRVSSVRVDEWAKSQGENCWKKVDLRESSKGKLSVEVLHQMVWLWDGEESQAHRWHLIVRREIESPQEIKYSLSNQPEETGVERLAYQQGQRYWVEHALQIGKRELGMADYQVRGWLGWHHHMAMVMLTMLFMLLVRREHRNEIPLLSCRDVVDILRVLLPQNNVTFLDIIVLILLRHRRRQSSINSAYAKQEIMSNSRSP